MSKQADRRAADGGRGKTATAAALIAAAVLVSAAGPSAALSVPKPDPACNAITSAEAADNLEAVANHLADVTGVLAGRVTRWRMRSTLKADEVLLRTYVNCLRSFLAPPALRGAVQ